MARPDDLFERITRGGVPVIASMIQSEETEELFLDYKRSADSGKGQRLHADDRQNLARAISGFGNGGRCRRLGRRLQKQ